MNVQQVIFGDNSAYSYKFRIDIPASNKTLIETVKDWATETGFRCCIVPGFVYVRDEKDAAWFILRWA